MKITIEKETKLKDGKEDIWYYVYKDGCFQNALKSEEEAKNWVDNFIASITAGYPKKETIFEKEIPDQQGAADQQ